MTQIWQFSALATLASATLALAWASIALARRVSASRSASAALGRRVDDLSLRLRAVETRPSLATPKPPTRPTAAPAPAWRGVTRRVDAPMPSASAGPTLIAVPSLASLGSEAVASEAAGGLLRRFGAIWTLADSGESTGAIAGATGYPIGQVELILGLRRSSGLAEPSGASNYE